MVVVSALQRLRTCETEFPNTIALAFNVFTEEVVWLLCSVFERYLFEARLSGIVRDHAFPLPKKQLWSLCLMQPKKKLAHSVQLLQNIDNRRKRE